MKMMGALPDFERGSVIAMAMLVPSVISVMLLRYMEKFNFRYNKISRYEVQRSFMRDGAFGFCCAFSTNILHFFTTPYLMIKSSLSKMNESWETTGLLMGDTWLKTVIKVVIPNSRATICQMLSYFFVNAMVTISAIVFLAGARTMVITTKIKELQYFEKFDAVFVLSLLIFFTNVVAKTFFDKLAEQEEIPLYKKIKNLFKAKENPNEKFC